MSDDSAFVEPYLLDNIKDNMQGNRAFEHIMQGLDENLDDFNRITSEETNQRNFFQQENQAVGPFDHFLRTTFSNFSRDSPLRQNRLSAAEKKSVLRAPSEKVGFLKGNLKNELRTLKVFTIIDKKTGEMTEIDRDLASLHNEIPNYFAKPRLTEQRLPEVVKNKKNMMFVLRAIKSREQKRQ